MNKPPAFQFYPQDYLSSSRVAEMTLEEEGAYIRLLCYCWTIGSIPADPVRCAKLAGKSCSIETATNVQRAFNVCSTDVQRMVHDRLEKERENQRLRREQTSKAGKKSAQSRAQKVVNCNPETTKNKRSTDVQQNINPSSSSSDEESVSKPKRKQSTRDVVESDPMFDQFWDIYPNKVAKGKARTSWAKALKTTDAETILSAVEVQRKNPKCSLGGKQEFIPHPSSWLNAERWCDPVPQKESKFFPTREENEAYYLEHKYDP